MATKSACDCGSLLTTPKPELCQCLMMMVYK